jgi:hypothetical protein
MEFCDLHVSETITRVSKKEGKRVCGACEGYRGEENFKQNFGGKNSRKETTSCKTRCNLFIIILKRIIQKEDGRG